jgi:membrane protein implicated in regulation of membrane protease activity
MIAFISVELISIYHLRTMLRRKKRKTDWEKPTSEVAGLKEILALSNFLTRIIFYVIIVYTLCALVFFIPVFGPVPWFPDLYFTPKVLMVFTMISFGLMALISAYHLSTVLRRRKRKTDWA